MKKINKSNNKKQQQNKFFKFLQKQKIKIFVYLKKIIL